jgi:hypothetical protein
MKIPRATHSHPGSPAKMPAVGGTQGKGFAAKLSQAERAAGLRGPERATPPHKPTKPTGMAALGADLKAGKVTAEAAVDQVVEQVLDRQLGKHAAVALRAKLGAALRQSLADDPLLAAKVRALSHD